MNKFTLEWLDKQIKKDNLDIEKHKQKLISELKNIDKKELFKEKVEKKKPFLDRFLKLF